MTASGGSGQGSPSSRGPAIAFGLAVFAAFLPGVPGWVIAARHSRIPTLPAVHERDLLFAPPGVPPLADAETLAARADGTVFVADWKREHVLALDSVRPGAGRWLPPAGRFELQLGPGGGLHLLDQSTGVLHRFSTDGRLETSSRVASPGGTFSLAVDPKGALFVAEKERNLVRKLTPELGPDVSFGRGGVVGVPSVVGVAASAERLYVVSETGSLFVLSADGRLLGREELVGIAGRLALGPGHRVLLMADRRADRIWVFDVDGRMLGKLSPSGRPEAFSEPRALAFTPQGTLYVASRDHVGVFRPTTLGP